MEPSQSLTLPARAIRHRAPQPCSRGDGWREPHHRAAQGPSWGPRRLRSPRLPESQQGPPATCQGSCGPTEGTAPASWPCRGRHEGGRVPCPQLSGSKPQGRAQPSREEVAEPGGRRPAVGAGEGEGRPVFCPRCLTLGCWSEDRRSGVKWQKKGGPIPLQLPGAEREASRCPWGLQGQRQGRRWCPAGRVPPGAAIARRPGGGGLSRAVRGPCGLGVSAGLGGAPPGAGTELPSYKLSEHSSLTSHGHEGGGQLAPDHSLSWEERNPSLLFPDPPPHRGAAHRLPATGLPYTRFSAEKWGLCC